MILHGDIIKIPDVFGCDFSNRSAITVVIFDGHGAYGIDLQKRIRNFYEKVNKYTLVKFNIVIVKDGQRPGNHYTANFKGLSGICTNLSELSKILFQKCFAEYNTERMIYFSDCGGSAPAIITGTELPVHSINMITPYLQVLGRKHVFDVKSYNVHISKETTAWIDENCDEDQYFDQMHYVDLYLGQLYGKLTMHWSKKIYGTDLFFNHLAKRYSKKVNCNIVEWDMSEAYDPHLLYKWLRRQDNLFKLIAKEVNEQYLILNPGESSDQGVTAVSNAVGTERYGDRALGSPLNITL